MLNDVIKKYDLAFQTLESSTNPKIQLLAIINFFKFLEEKKQFGLFDKFINDFLTYIINIFKNSSVNFIDPEYFVISRFLLKKALKNGNADIVTNEILTTIDLINIRLLLLYYYLGEIDNGLIILKDILNSKTIVDSGISMEHKYSYNNKFTKKKSSVIDPNIFKINKSFDILRRINFEINRINSVSDYSANILLVETDNTGINYGTIIALECDIKLNNQKDSDNPRIENMTDIQGEGLHSVKEKLIKTVRKILNIYNSKFNLNKYLIKLKYSDYKSIYKGVSFGAGASILIASQYLTVSNSRKRFKISNSAAFTGPIEESGNVIKIPNESVEAKTEAAFFSWIKYLIIPFGNIEVAKNKIDSLQKKYPSKKLKVIGINNITDVLQNKDIVKDEEDSLLQHSRNTVKRHRTISYITFSFLLIILTAFTVNKLIPKKSKPIPVTSQQLNMIYCPDRDTIWKFTSSDKTRGDTIFFGETAIGDIWYHKMDLWNNDDKKAPLRIDIEGENKDEFEIIWGIDLSQKDIPDFAANDIKEKLFIKFVPFKDTGEKKAKLVFYNADNPNKKKEIFLKGNAGNFNNGYSLKLKDDDEFIINPKGNVLQNEFSFSFWFKPKYTETFLLQSETQNWTQTKFSSRITRDTILSFLILNSKMDPVSNYELKSKSKANLGEWNFLSVSHMNNVTQIIFNDEIIDFQTKENHFLQIEDLFYFGKYHPLRRGTYNVYEERNEVEIAEIRLYNKQLLKKEILNKKFSKENPFDNRLICYYDFEEATGKAVWDKTKNDVFAELYALPGRSLDIPPIHNENQKKYFDTYSDNYIQISGKGQIILNKNIFQPKSDFTIQFEAKLEGDYKSSYLNISEIKNYESIFYCWNIVNGDSIFIGLNHPLFPKKDLAKIIIPIESKWYKYTMDYSYLDKKGRFFIDGKLFAEYYINGVNYDFTRDIFYILFGNYWCYDNPRFIGKVISVDNISIFNKVLDTLEVKLTKPEDILKIKGLLAFWNLNNIENHLCYDEVNRVPIFLWEDFQIIKK